MRFLIRHSVFAWVTAILASQAVAAQQTRIEGADLLTSKAVIVSAESKKALVAVFLSAVCPCSNSHIKELSLLAKEYPNFSFIGIHSNTDEKPEPTKAYFEQAKLPFPVIQDTGAKLADQYKALKTPHAFIIKPNGEIVYRGGVSSSRNFDSADRKFLREALEDVEKNRPVRTPEGRTLGCVISRGEKYVW